MIFYLVFLLLFFFFFQNFDQQAILLLIRFSFDVLFLQNANCWLFSINREKGAAMVKRLGGNSEFTEVNIDDHQSLEAALMGGFTSLFGNYRWYFFNLINLFTVLDVDFIIHLFMLSLLDALEGLVLVWSLVQ